MSFVIRVNPHNVKAVPNIKFLGPERLIEMYRTRLVENWSNWNTDGDIVTELLKLLGEIYF